MPPADCELRPTVHEDQQRSVIWTRRQIAGRMRTGFYSVFGNLERCCTHWKFLPCDRAVSCVNLASCATRGKPSGDVETSRAGIRKNGASDRLVYGGNRRP